MEEILYNKKSIRDLDLAGKNVFVRVDFNVPINDGEITDDSRILAAIPTIQHLINAGARTVLASHLGKPTADKASRQALSMAPIAAHLSGLLKREVKFIDSAEVVDGGVTAAARNLKNGDVLLLQNTRYRPEETKNGDEFSRQLAALGEIYVSDAFGTAHRAHSSVVGAAKLMDQRVAGFLIEKELKYLGDAVSNPERPFAAVLGGAKISDKLMVIDSLLEKTDIIIIGGAMAYTFLKAKGYKTGKSMTEDDRIQYALDMIKKADERGVQLLLPVDHIMAAEFSNDAEALESKGPDIPEEYMGLDIGPQTVRQFTAAIAGARTIVWNGPMGVFEFDKFSNGTRSIAKAIAGSMAVTIVGGGDSAAAVNQMGFADKISHISTGGGASLQFLEGEILPGIAVLEDK